MPILASTTYVNAYGKNAGIIAFTQAPTLTGNNTQDGFVVKYDSAGKSVWSARVSGAGTDTVTSMTTDISGNVYVTGDYISGDIAIYSSDGTLSFFLTQTGGRDVFIIKYNALGIAQWATKVASTGTDQSFGGLSCDSSGNVYVCASVSASTANTVVTAFNSNGTAFGTTFTIAIGGRPALALVKYNTSGNVQWLARMSTPSGTNRAYSIATDSNANVYITGSYLANNSGEVFTAFNASGTAFGTTLPFPSGSDTFIVKYNTTGSVQWVTRIASTDSEIGQGIATDSSGNVYVTGNSGNAVATAFSSNGTGFATTIPVFAAFIVKYTTGGAVTWVAHINSTSTDIGYGIVTDSNSDVYVTGSCGSGATTTAFSSNGTAFSPTLPNSGGNDVFIVKYSTSGTVQWFARIASTQPDIGASIFIDSSNNVYLTGNQDAAGTITAFNANGTTFGTTNPLGLRCSFIAKYNTSGVVQWLTSITSESINRAYAITIDTANNVYIGGIYSSVSRFDIFGQSFGIFSTTGATTSSADGFVVKYNANGSPQWVGRLSSTGADYATAVAADSSGNVYLTGASAFNGAQITTAFNADGSAFGTTIANRGLGDIPIIKYNSAGVVQWVARVGSTAVDFAYGIATDTSGNVYLIGTSTGSIAAFNANGTQFSFTTTNNGSNDIFLVKYNTSGTVQWLAKVSSSGADESYSITTDSNGAVYLVGTSQGINAYTAGNNNTIAAQFTGKGLNDAFVVKYNTSGTVQWVAGVATSGADSGTGVAVDSQQNVYICGTASTGTITAYNSDTSTFSPTLTNSSGVDTYLAKFNSNGTVQWIINIESTSNDNGYRLGCDSNNNVYFIGRTASSYFLRKYNSSGVLQWSRTLPSLTGELLRIGLSVDPSGNAYVRLGGARSSTWTLTDGDNTNFATGFGGNILIKYNTSGFPQWVQYLSTPNLLSDTNYTSIASDPNGNVYVTTSYTNEALVVYNTDFTPYKYLASSSSTDAYVIKYSSTATPLWAAKIGGLLIQNGYGIAVDSTTNSVYVTGQGGSGSSTVAYSANEIPFATTLTNIASNDVYIVKYNSSGTVQWLTRIASSNIDTGNSITTDSSGNIYVTGTYQATLTAYNADTTPFTTTLTNSGGTGDIFVIKYNSAGTVQWVTRIASSAGTADIGYAITTDTNGNIYLNGRAGGASSSLSIFNSNNTIFTTLSASSSGAYLVKYDSDGFVQWVGRVGTTTGVTGFGVSTDSNNNVYVTGQGVSGASLTIFNSNGSTFGTIANSGGTDVFVAKYNSSGNVQWAARIASTGTDIGYAIAADSGGNVYVTGQGGSGVTVSAFNSDGTAFSTTNTNIGGTDIFLVKYDTTGTVQWIARLGGTGTDIGYSVTTDSAGDVYISGYYTGTLRVFNSNGTFAGSSLDAIVGSGTTIPFIAKYSSSGTALWVSTMGAFGDSRQVVVDSSTNIYTVGSFTSGGLVFNNT
jgi:Tfp pilus assembly protein PilZ